VKHTSALRSRPRLVFHRKNGWKTPFDGTGKFTPMIKNAGVVDAAQRLVTGNPLRSSYRVMTRDGRVIWFQCEVRMIRREDGRPWFIHGVGFDISELKRTEEALEEHTAALRSLSSHLLRIQDKEYRRIARELHDSLGQYLVALKMNLHALKEREGNNPDPVWEQSEKILESCLTETRTISHLLHPPLLDEVGFLAAAALYIDGFAKRSAIAIRPTCLLDFNGCQRKSKLLFSAFSRNLSPISSGIPRVECVDPSGHLQWRSLSSSDRPWRGHTFPDTGALSKVGHRNGSRPFRNPRASN
jgi:hypothetical protein